jgi:hypothetical protein
MYPDMDKIVRASVHACQRLVSRYKVLPENAARVYMACYTSICKGTCRKIYTERRIRVYRIGYEGVFYYALWKNGIIVTFLTSEMVFENMLNR